MKLVAYIFIFMFFVLSQSYKIDMIALAEEHNEEVAKQTIEETPEWFAEFPKSETMLYARGTAVSGDMQLSIDKASIAAKRSLADKLKSIISSKTQMFAKEAGMDENTKIYNELEQITSNTINETKIGSYNEFKSKTVLIGSKYRTFFVLEYPIVEAYKILLPKIENNPILEESVQTSQAYKDLEKEIRGIN
tara:strand:- start:483 stop:1058 length:576 start_codon:yes stop_codon:yes gene_type:complete